MHHHIAAALEPPCEIVLRKRRRLTRRPAEEMSVGVIGGAQDFAFVAGRGIRFVETARRLRRIDPDVRVMHAGVSRPELEAANISQSFAGNRQHEVAEHVGAVRPQDVLRKREHDVGLAELPARPDARRRRQIFRVALGRPVAHPLVDRANLGVGQPPLADEMAGAGFRFPGRHDPRARDERDLRGAAAGGVVRCQGEWRGTVRPMARRALAKQNRRDVPVKGEWRLRRRARSLIRPGDGRRRADEQSGGDAKPMLHSVGSRLLTIAAV